MGFSFRSLTDVSPAEMANCINFAFSDYELPTHVDEQKLLTMFKSSGVVTPLSFGAFNEQNELCGIMINAVGEYKSCLTAFDVITGVVPGARGKGAFKGMFSLMSEQLKKEGIGKYTLEVLKSNTTALKLYTSLGMKPQRDFQVLLKNKDSSTQKADGITTVSLSSLITNNILLPGKRVPSYENTPSRLMNTAELYNFVYTGTDTSPDAFAICRNDTGYIAHADCAYGKENVLKNILAYVSAKDKKIMVKNIDDTDSELKSIYSSLGYAEYATQFELSLTL